MAEIRAPEMPAELIPDDLTIPQFFLDTQHELQPVHKPGAPWLIEEATGREIGHDEVRDFNTGGFVA